MRSIEPEKVPLVTLDTNRCFVKDIEEERILFC